MHSQSLAALQVVVREQAARATAQNLPVPGGYGSACFFECGGYTAASL